MQNDPVYTCKPKREMGNDIQKIFTEQVINKRRYSERKCPKSLAII